MWTAMMKQYKWAHSFYQKLSQWGGTRAEDPESREIILVDSWR